MARMVLSNDELQRRTTVIGAPRVHHSAYRQAPGTKDCYDTVEADTFDTVVHEGRVRFVRNYEGWKGEIIENPTMADALRQMEKSIEDLRDEHHIFFEGLGKPKAVEVGRCGACGHEADPGTVVYEIDICTGS